MIPRPIKRGFGKEGRTVLEILKDPEYMNWLSDVAQMNIPINIQQVTKSPVIMDCMVPEKGYDFVGLDFSALEPHVTAELSGCPTYEEIYASGKPHDVYLYVAIKLLEDVGPKINEVYNIDNPTKESVGKAKKLFKSDRTMVKPIHLGLGYNMGADKMRRELKLKAKVDKTEEQVKALIEKYWSDELFGAVKRWEDELLAEREDRGGYILNGLGRPFVITDDKATDIINTCVQSTGHDLLDVWAVLVWEQLDKFRLRDKIKIPLDDNHDEMVLESPNKYSKDVAKIMEDCVGEMNAKLTPKIPLKGEAEVGGNMTLVREPDEVDWYNKAKLRWKVGA